MTAVVAVKIVEASFGYGARPVLEDVTLTMRAGASVALLGTNGSGKSTLLKAIVGLLRPQRGEIRVFNTTPRAARPDIGYLPQQPWSGRVAPMTVLDAVRIGQFARLGWFGRQTSADRAAVDDAMARLGITALAQHTLHELSGGQRQRVQLAQVLAQQARLLLLDEPLTGLDPPTQQQVSGILAEEHERGTTIITATHEIAVARHSDLAVLLRGRIIAADEPQHACTDENLIATFGSPIGEAIVPTLKDHHHTDSVTRPITPRVPRSTDR